MWTILPPFEIFIQYEVFGMQLMGTGFSISCCLACFLVAAVWAEGTIPFSKAREIILIRNKGLEAANMDMQAARSGVRQAGALPNPGISVGLDQFGANELEAGVEQTIELGGKRKYRKRAAQQDLEVAQNLQKLTAVELEAEIVRRFIPISVDSRKLALLDSIIAAAQATREQIQRRVEAGATRKADLIRAEIELDRLFLERREMARQIGQSRRKFAALGGEGDSALAGVSGSLKDEAAVPSLQDLRNALAASPQFRAMDIESARLATQQKQQRAEIVPDLDLSAGVLRNNEEGYTSPIIGAGTTIPLFNWNSAARKQTEYQRQAVLQRRENELRLAEAEVRDLQTRLLEIDRKIHTLSTGTIPKAENVYAMLTDYYNAGNASFLDLAESQSDLLQLQIELLDVRAERAQTLTDLMQTTSLQIEIVK